MKFISFVVLFSLSCVSSGQDALSEYYYQGAAAPDVATQIQAGNDMARLREAGADFASVVRSFLRTYEGSKDEPASLLEELARTRTFQRQIKALLEESFPLNESLDEAETKVLRQLIHASTENISRLSALSYKIRGTRASAQGSIRGSLKNPVH